MLSLLIFSNHFEFMVQLIQFTINQTIFNFKNDIESFYED